MGDYKKGAKFLDEQINKNRIESGFFDDTEPEAQEWKDNLSDDIDYVIPFDCIARDIQLWILDTSEKKQPAIALCSALAIMATVKGRLLRFNGGIKGNPMFMILADSGDGKDWGLQCIQKFLHESNMGYRVATKMASGAALTDKLEETPSLCLCVDEAGHDKNNITGKNSSSHAKEIVPMITEMYSRSASVYISKTSKANGTKTISEPNLVYYGASTEKQFFKASNEDEVEDGSLARYFVVFGEKDAPPNMGRARAKSIPSHIKDYLMGYSRIIYADNFTSDEVSIDTEYLQEFDYMRMRYHALAVECGKKESTQIFKPFYKRLAVKAAQIALLIDECKDVKVLEWAANLCEQANDIFIKKFNHKVASNTHESMVKTIEAAIKESGKAGISKSGMYNRTRSIPKYLKESILTDMIESGKVFTRDIRIGNARQETKHYFWKK